MQAKAMQLHADDDLAVALTALRRHDSVACGGATVRLINDIHPKHKFAIRDIPQGGDIRMYGIVIAKAATAIPRGALASTVNLKPATAGAVISKAAYTWTPPDISAWADADFAGFHRRDGKVGTANYWIVVPLVFCENRNIRTLADAFLEELGYRKASVQQHYVRELCMLYQEGKSPQDIRRHRFQNPKTGESKARMFKHLDGVKFLTHGSGCGATREDAETLCGLLAGYITHPNVAGATVLSLGCQNAQVKILEDAIHHRDPRFRKPLYIFEQQKIGTVQSLMEQAVKHTFAGLIEADQCRRQPAPLHQLVIGVECGGSDGFSGISANPAIGHCSDLMVACGGSVILSEFPELSGVEQELCDRCVRRDHAERFMHLMRAFAQRLRHAGSGFEANPSPGNIRDGLLTGAMKSAGAARKGGSAPVVDVIDYPEPARQKGLTLLCTPGGDVESTTAMAGSGATIMLFSTGLGTPTGNPVTPVIKIASNTPLYRHMPDIIDLDAGRIITGRATVQAVGEEIFHVCLQTASGQYQPKAMRLGQDDFLPWKRGFSL